jgi:hypothetical protein
LAAKGVHFPYKVAFGKPPHGGIAGERAYAVGVLGNKEGGKSKPGRRQSGFNAGVAAAYDNAPVISA